MKTSNKLLIAFVAFLFFAPLLCMVAISDVFYKDVPKLNMAEVQEANNQPLQSASLGRKTILLDKPFDAINFPDGNNFSVEVHVNTSEKYGIKIPEDLANSIKVNVSGGVLNIEFDKELPLSNINERIFIVVYAPILEKLKANNFMNLNLVAQTDSLVVNVAKCYFSLGNSDITLTKMDNKGDTLNHGVSNQTIIKNLKIIGNYSNINISGLDLNNLDIKATNNSNIKLDGNYFHKGESTIKNLIIETSGKNQVSIKNFNLSNTKSNFSDSTQLTIPTSILKILLKD